MVVLHPRDGLEGRQGSDIELHWVNADGGIEVSWSNDVCGVVC
jgi:hypothetical protein